MTSSQRINPPRAIPSVTPASAPKTGSGGVADDFAAKLTHARGASKTTNTNSAPPPKSSEAPEVAAAAEETQPEKTETTGASKSAKNSRPPREAKDGESSDQDDAATSAAPLPGDVIAALNVAPPAAPVPGAAQGNAAAPSSVAGDDDAALADATKGAVAERRAPRASATTPALNAGTLVGTTAPSVAVQADQAAPSDSKLPLNNLVAAADELRASKDQGTSQTALAMVSDALQSAASTASATDGNATGTAIVPTNTSPDAAANAALSQLNAMVSDSSSLVRNTHGMTQHTLHTPVGAHGWSDELATRLTWMVDQHQNAATLRLTPDNMGPVEVRIDVRENQVSVWFGAAQADTRAAIESALPRLRELLQGQGLSLADAGVSQQSQREASRNLHTPQGTPFREAEGVSEMSVALRVGLFDGYA